MADCNCRSEEDNRKLIVRLNRIEGQIRTIKSLIENEDESKCMDLLNQVRSATCAMRGVWEVIAARHLENCVDNLDKAERNKIIEEIISCLKELR